MEIQIIFGTVWGARLSLWRLRLSLEQCGDMDYLRESVEIQIMFETVWIFRLCFGQCGDSDYVWDSVDIQIIFGTV